MECQPLYKVGVLPGPTGRRARDGGRTTGIMLEVVTIASSKAVPSVVSEEEMRKSEQCADIQMRVLQRPVGITYQDQDTLAPISSSPIAKDSRTREVRWRSRRPILRHERSSKA